MNKEVSRGQREGESRETQFTHMVLVSGLPLRTMWSWNKLYISQFKGIFKTLLPATERSLSVISYMDNTHCATETYITTMENWNGGR